MKTVGYDRRRWWRGKRRRKVMEAAVKRERA